MLQKDHSRTTNPMHLVCFYSCSSVNTNPMDPHQPCLYILDVFLYIAVQEVFPWVYHIGQRSCANTDKLEKHSESPDLHQTDNLSPHLPPMLCRPPKPVIWKITKM